MGSIRGYYDIFNNTEELVKLQAWIYLEKLI